jgi:hypothetical protein
MKLSDEFRAEVFNQLEDPQEANSLLQSLPTSLEQLGSIIRKYRLENHVGLRLLHKHYVVSRGEVVMATIEGNTISTRARKNIDCTGRPNAWKLQDSEWCPVELLQEPGEGTTLAEGKEKIEQSPGFLAEMTQKVRELGVANVLGITLLLNGMIAIPAGHTLHEESNELTRTSVSQVIETRSTTPHIHIIDTHWGFPGEILEPVVLAGCGHKPKPDK